MQTIYYENYNINMGQIIDLEDPLTFRENHLNGSINIPYDKLIYNPEKYLSKTKTYYLTCEKGVKSKKACSILSIHGYNVVQLKK